MRRATHSKHETTRWKSSMYFWFRGNSNNRMVPATHHGICRPILNLLTVAKLHPASKSGSEGESCWKRSPMKTACFFLSDIAEMSHFKERDVFQAWLIQLLANGDPAAKDFCCCSDEGHLLPLRTWKMDRCKRGCSKWKCGCEPTTMRCNPSKTLTIFYI